MSYVGTLFLSTLTLRVMIAAKNLRASPTTMILEQIPQTSLKTYSIKIGATFSPPAVITNSFILPVILRKPSLSITPMSPECMNPSLSNTSLVYFSIL